MFDFMKGGKTALKLSLDRPVSTDGIPAQPYYLGETVHASLTLTSEKEIKIREGRIALVYHEEYQYRYHHRSSDSHGHSRTTVATAWATDEREVSRQVFLGEETIPGGATKAFEFDFPIPVEAAPSARADIVKIEWLLKATLDRRLSGDVEDTVVLPVYLAAPGVPSQVGPTSSSEPDEADLEILLPKTEWMMGETVAGRLQIRPKKAFGVTEIRAELVQRQLVPRGLGNQHEVTTAVKLNEGTQVAPEQDLTLPFNIPVPLPAPATFTSPNATLTWWLRGVLARRLRKDTFVEQELFVYNGLGPR